MSEMFICPACNGDGYARPRDHEAEAPNHTPMQPDELRAACEAYLRENGWEKSESGLWSRNVWSFDLAGALDVQWARDGIGGAT